ncbi:PilN domain-containing protein [Motilimonas eburnea]|uniref:PilN domain-containing protein n=1 Tax=Motilimonas eburnea TaxID=1737488 RepID=UPI001E61188C|nr:PilN domain-containing protein [Motilimonas eburnea]MCE2572136.1 PilN domain-containing protein [Motilimonas eburnea]
MKTRVNLYTQEFIPKKVWFCLRQMCIIWGMAIGVVSVSYFWLEGQYQLSQATQQQSHQALAKQQQALAVLQAKVDQRVPSAKLARQLSQMQAELSVKQKLLAAVGQNETFKNAGFAGVLTDLARLNDKDIRLTEIRAESGQISLSGITYSNHAVPRWIKTFKTSDTLAGQEFAVLKVVRNDKQEMVFELVAAAGKQEQP